jgi:hypothetical protein
MMAIEINTQFIDTQQNRGKPYSLAVEENTRTLGSRM